MEVSSLENSSVASVDSIGGVTAADVPARITVPGLSLEEVGPGLSGGLLCILSSPLLTGKTKIFQLQ